jgi:hypothetical protein
MDINLPYINCLGIQNPITLAWALLHTQKQGLMDGGRIPPW